VLCAAVASGALGSRQIVQNGTVNQTTTWRCTGPVALDSVTVTIGPSSPSTDAVLLDKGCTGTIGRIDVVQYKGDGIKFGAANDLTINGGSVRCYAHLPGKHQDGIQVLGGTHIRVSNLDVGCYTANNSQVWMNPAGQGSSNGASDLIFDHSRFDGHGSGSYGFANMQSTDSGLTNSLVCPNAHPKREYLDKGATRPVNSGNTIAASC
jgi:hypothetical protein